jgi:hypothetical protein
MRTFTDKNGREWQIDLTIGEVERVKRDSRFNLYEPFAPFSDPALERISIGRPTTLQDCLAGNWSTLWELVFVICEPQLKQAGVDGEEFGKAMNAKALTASRKAFWDEWHDFFLQLDEPMTAKGLEVQMKAFAAALQAATAKAADPRMAQLAQRMERRAEEMMEAGLDEAFRAESAADGNSPPGNTPAS